MTGPLLTHDGTVHGTGNGDPLTHIDSRHGPLAPTKDDTMTPEQFAELKALMIELLTPGYELSKIYLAKYQADVAAAEAAAKAAAEQPAT